MEVWILVTFDLTIVPSGSCQMTLSARPSYCSPFILPEVLFHPPLQLLGDLLFLPLTDVCHKHSGVEGAVSGVDAQVLHFLFPVVQEAHVSCLGDELRGEDVFQWQKLSL